MVYTQKAVTVTAHQVTRDCMLNVPMWLNEAALDGKAQADGKTTGDGVRYFGIVVRTPEGKIKARPGDYIVREPDGSLRVLTNAHFKRLYEGGGK